MSLKHKTYTLSPVGADGSAAASKQVTFGRPGIIRALAIDYTAQPATADVTIKADNASGRTLFTKADNTTDVALTPVGMPGIDEGGAALAASDASSGGLPFYNGFYIAVAQGDGCTNQEVQTIDLGDISTADTFKLATGAGGTAKTATITYDTTGSGTAMAADIQAKLNAVLGVGAVSVVKTSNSVFVVTWAAIGDQTLLQVTDTATFDPKTDGGYTLGAIETTKGSTGTEAVAVDLLIEF